MPRLCLRLQILVFFSLFAGINVPAQTTDTQAREAEWKSHKLPAAEFKRYVDLEKILLFRVPESWQQTGLMRFKGPSDSELQVLIEKVPDGIPLKSYTNALLQNLRNLPGGADALTVRTTEISALEAREFLFVLPDPLGQPTRRVMWSTVSGPRAISFLLAAPEAKASEVEPYFKAVLASAVIFESEAHYTIFDSLRSRAIKEDKPVRVDEVRSLAAVIDGFDAEARAKAVGTLASLFNSAPDAAIDLLVDRRAIVRAAAVEALGRSSNHALDGFLLLALADRSAFVGARAAQAIASREDAVKLLRDDSGGWGGLQIERVMRAMALLDDRARSQIAGELIKEMPEWRARKKAISPPPPPPPRAVRTPAQPGKPKQSAAPPNGAAVPGGIPVGIPGGIAASQLGFDYVPGYNDEFAVLGMLPYLEPLASVWPASKLIDQLDGTALRLALTLALESRTKLPVDRLIKLLSSAEGENARLAALNLAVSATGADIPRLEGFSRDVFTVSGLKPGDYGYRRPLREELLVTAKKIRWRERFASTASLPARDESIKEAFADNELAGFAWPYIRDVVEGAGPNQSRPMRGSAGGSAVPQKPAPVISPLAENLLPSKVSLYTAIPDAQSLVDKLGDSLSGVQLESARNQANFLLMMKAIESQVARGLAAKAGAGVLESAGIKPHSPLVFARWTAEGAPRGLQTAQRKAVVVRVNDRDRFESFVATFQRQVARFEKLPEYVSAGARFLSVLPAVLPLVAAAMSGGRAPLIEYHGTRYSVIGADNCEGYPVTVIEHREVATWSLLHRDTIYLTYVGDAAVLATDWFSLRDCLRRVEGKGESLASNADFKRAVAAGGDVVYLSDPLALFGSTATNDQSLQITEKGALRISRSGWESTFGLSFNARDWQKPLSFSASRLRAPAELLPRSSLAYLFMNLDVAAAWHGFSKTLLGAETAKQFESIWAMDFEREVMAELGPEVGVALLGLPSMKNDPFAVKDEGFGAPWVLFVQTNSGKLGAAFDQGKLLKSAGAGGKAVQVKIGSSEYWLAVKNGFLIVAGSEAAVGKLDSSERLKDARDFQMSASAAPGGIIAFGGCNIEAATDGLTLDKNDPLQSQAVGLIVSLARAFHSLNFYASLGADGLNAKMSVSLGRDGRYSVSDLAALSKDFEFAAAEVEARGVPIADQQRLDSLALLITSKAPSAIDRIKEDITSRGQTAEKRSDSELLVTIRPRRPGPAKAVELPVTGSEFAPFLKPSKRVNSEDAGVIARAREIAGDDRNAWSVAVKLADWTFKNLKWKRVDDADAAHTLATREADCLEFSQLFVAMARSLGLPARIVLGMAHTGSSFGGHAWVEVWAGEWVEMDPTWGTNFVDATHIRSAAFELDSYAALNVIGIEVLEARRGIAEFQKDPGALAEALCEEFNGRGHDALAVALDPAVLIDSLMGEGAWAGMNASERDQVYSSQRRLVAELEELLGEGTIKFGPGVRLLKVKQTKDGAEAFIMTYTDLFKARLLRKGDAWFVREISLEDLGYSVIAESMRPTLLVLQAKRKGVRPPAVLDSAEARILIARQQDVKQALQIAEQALKENPNNQTLRYLKAVCLLPDDEEPNDPGIEKALSLLTTLAGEQPVFVPAVRELGEHYAAADDEDPEIKSKQAKAVEFLERYCSLLPEDPRPHEKLATLYEARNDAARAEAEYRKVVELDPRSPGNYADFARFLFKQSRYKEALAAIDQSKGRGQSKDEMFASLFLAEYGEPDGAGRAESLASAAPDRMAKNFQANLNLASVLVKSGRPADALPLLKHAAELDPKSATPHTSMAEAYRKLHNWTAALKSAGEAIKLDEKDAEAHFHRACALAQLRRPVEALAALRKAVELDEELTSVEDLEKEPDLTPLEKLPGFKKLVEELRQKEEPVTPQKKSNDK